MSAPRPFAQLAKVLSVAGLCILAVGAAYPWADGLIAPARAASARKAKAKKAGKDFSYAVSDCHGAGELPSIRLEVSEGAVEFSQILTMNCIAATRPGTAQVTYAKKGKNLEVSVVLRSNVLSDCTCPIGIDGRITNLRKGSYRITFFYEGPPGISPNEPPVRRTVGSDEFSIQ